MLELEAVDIGYRSRQGEIPVVRQIDLKLEAGEFTCLLGPNGAGKSTLMRTIAGMQPPLAGRLRIDGQDLLEISSRERARLFAVVLTERVTAGLLTSYALVSLGRHPHTNWLGRLTEKDHEIIRSAFDLAGATILAPRFVSELSDGERQRVMLARALAQEPRLMILDEITAFLDLPRRVEIMSLLKRLARETRCAVLVSTHDLDLALRNADCVWLLGNDGKLRSGAPEDLVLSGALAASFSDEGIDFDPLRGVLQARKMDGAPVMLVGEQSVHREWTQRALERCGFRVVSEAVGNSGDCPRVEVLGEAGWTLRLGGTTQSYPTLHGVTGALASLPGD